MNYWINEFGKKTYIKWAYYKTFKNKTIKELVLSNNSCIRLDLDNCIIEKLVIKNAVSKSCLTSIYFKSCTIDSLEIAPLINEIRIWETGFLQKVSLKTNILNIGKLTEPFIVDNTNYLKCQWKNEFPIIISSENHLQRIDNPMDCPIIFEKPYRAVIKTLFGRISIKSEETNSYYFNKVLPPNIIPLGYVIKFTELESYKNSFGYLPYFLVN
jgi:hypothetical protein